MVLPPKELAWRLIVWSLVFGWAVWKMRDLKMEDVAPPPVGAVDVTLVSREPAKGAAPAVVDVEAATRAMDAAIAGARACGAGGTIAVRLDAGGLAEAHLRGTGDVACVTRAVTEQAWPATAQGFEMERGL
ncbi:MAG: hypothetical protein ACOZNI_24265 [Myxococcota bacterium]